MVHPRLRLAIADHALCSTASLSRWTHLVGVSGAMHRANNNLLCLLLHHPLAIGRLVPDSIGNP